MYWYNNYPYPYTSETEDAKYSTTYIKNGIGKWVLATLNYTSNSPINQNVECTGILRDVGNDYFVINEGSSGEDILFYTVNLARLRILKNPPKLPSQKVRVETKDVRKRKATH